MSSASESTAIFDITCARWTSTVFVAQTEGGRDLLVGLARGDELEDLALACAERRESSASLLAASPHLARLAIDLECLAHAIEQQLIAERLLDEVDRARLHGANRHRHLGVTRDHDGGQLGAALDQLGLEIESAHSGHAHVEYQTAGLRGLVLAQELRRRRVGSHGEADGFEQPSQRVAHRAVVVDDEDDRFGLRRHGDLRVRLAARRGRRRRGAGSETPTPVRRAPRRSSG